VAEQLRQGIGQQLVVVDEQHADLRAVGRVHQPYLPSSPGRECRAAG
jgi:hypothetical protein